MTAKAPASSSGGRGRSAISGQFVSKATVQWHPKTTVTEKVKKSGK